MNRSWFAPALIGAAVLGWLAATLFGDLTWLADTTRIMQSTFLSALRMIIVPLIFFSLITGILQLRSASQMGRLGAVTLGYYMATSAIAIGIGLVVVFVIHPWTAHPPITDLPDLDLRLIDSTASGAGALIENLLGSMLVNPFDAMANGNILGVLVSAVLFGVAAALALPADSRWPDMLAEITQVIYRLAGWILLLLPLGLFAITFQLTERIDGSTLISLGQFAAVVLGATALHGLVILPLIAWALGGMPPHRLLPRVAQPMLTALVTSSSAATLPLSMTTAESKLGVARSKASFVLPLGATINMDGTALFEGIAVIFLAYMFSIPLSGLDILVVFFITMLASAGAPGIPSGSMAGLQVVLLAVGIPLEAIGLLLLIERPLDTFRTAVNVEGDLVGALIAERWG